MKRIFFIVLMALCCTVSFAAGEETERDTSLSKARLFISQARKKVDAFIDKHQKVTTDTFYVYRPKSIWRFQMYGDVYGHNLSFRQNETEKTLLHSLCKSSVGFGVAYRNIALYISLDPIKMLKKSSNIEYNINYYGSCWGADIQLSRINSLVGTSSSSDFEIEESATFRNVSLNGYYIFNHKRFSYSAVFDQSYIQRKSAGSPLVSLMGYFSSTDIHEEFRQLMTGNPYMKRLNMGFVAVGAGYAYNFVPKGRHWLIHLSAEPSITLWERTRAYYEDNSQRSSIRPVNFYTTGRVGATYFIDKIFIGANGIVQLYEAGVINNTNIQHLKYKGSLFVGVRF